MIERDKKLEFTFHYAKIKTVRSDSLNIFEPVFTFHYAKIKTRPAKNDDWY